MTLQSRFKIYPVPTDILFYFFMKFVHTYIHTYIHIYIHTYIYIRILLSQFRVSSSGIFDIRSASTHTTHTTYTHTHTPTSSLPLVSLILDQLPHTPHTHTHTHTHTLSLSLSPPHLLSLTCLQQESCWISLARIPLALVIFHPSTDPHFVPRL